MKRWGVSTFRAQKASRSRRQEKDRRSTLSVQPFLSLGLQSQEAAASSQQSAARMKLAVSKASSMPPGVGEPAAVKQKGVEAKLPEQKDLASHVWNKMAEFNEFFGQDWKKHQHFQCQRGRSFKMYEVAERFKEFQLLFRCASVSALVSDSRLLAWRARFCWRRSSVVATLCCLRRSRCCCRLLALLSSASLALSWLLLLLFSMMGNVIGNLLAEYSLFYFFGTWPLERSIQALGECALVLLTVMARVAHTRLQPHISYSLF